MKADKTPHIIYIEDDPEMVDLVSLILSRKDMRVTGAYNGQQGLDLINKEAPDLILLDIMMPDLDGWDVYHILKNNEQTKNIPVIIVTAKAQPIDRVLGIHVAGVEGFISKPFLPQDLFDGIEKVLREKLSP
jgi:two-component system, OmpR family, response regulator VicR